MKPTPAMLDAMATVWEKWPGAKDNHAFLSALFTAALSAAWSRPDTAPENTDVLCWYDWESGSDRFGVDRYRWIETIVEEVESECTNAKGRRRIIQERRERKREWDKGVEPDYWQQLPPSPAS